MKYCLCFSKKVNFWLVYYLPVEPKLGTAKTDAFFWRGRYRPDFPFFQGDRTQNPSSWILTGGVPTLNLTQPVYPIPVEAVKSLKIKEVQVCASAVCLNPVLINEVKSTSLFIHEYYTFRSILRSVLPTVAQSVTRRWRAEFGMLTGYRYNAVLSIPHDTSPSIISEVRQLCTYQVTPSKKADAGDSYIQLSREKNGCFKPLTCSDYTS
ncbi:hypothetical protein J6590_083940, partial [Homalodisca vitripennis]